MSPEVAVVPQDMDAATALRRVLGRLYDSETVYTIAVSDGTRRLIGVISLRDLLAAEPDTLMAELAQKADRALATEPAEVAARRVADRRRLALPVVDSEDRILGILTVDDALDILERAESEDQARQGGTEPLHRNYLSTPILRIVRSRIVWLLVLAIGASLTVHVLELFEETLSQLVVLSVFIPLVIGTGGNTGNQAATTVTRALALGEVRLGDVLRVMAREATTGVTLGLVLGGLGFTLIGLLYGPAIGWVIGLTLLIVYPGRHGRRHHAAARQSRAQTPGLLNPFISTFVDATGLIVYFLIIRRSSASRDGAGATRVDVGPGQPIRSTPHPPRRRVRYSSADGAAGTDTRWCAPGRPVGPPMPGTPRRRGGVGFHRRQRLLVEEVLLVVQVLDVGQVDARHRQRPAGRQGSKRVRDDVADRGEQDRRIQGHRR